MLFSVAPIPHYTVCCLSPLVAYTSSITFSCLLPFIPQPADDGDTFNSLTMASCLHTTGNEYMDGSNSQ